MIIDASVAFKWLVKEPDSAVAISWLDHDNLSAPALVHSEVGNALGKRIRRGEILADNAGENLQRLEQLLTIIDERPHMARALEMSLSLNHAFYDCVYLAMAESLGDELLTADDRFVQKVMASIWMPRIRALGAMI